VIPQRNVAVGRQEHGVIGLFPSASPTVDAQGPPANQASLRRSQRALDASHVAAWFSAGKTGPPLALFLAITAAFEARRVPATQLFLALSGSNTALSNVERFAPWRRAATPLFLAPLKLAPVKQATPPSRFLVSASFRSIWSTDPRSEDHRQDHRSPCPPKSMSAEVHVRRSPCPPKSMSAEVHVHRSPCPPKSMSTEVHVHTPSPQTKSMSTHHVYTPSPQQVHTPKLKSTETQVHRSPGPPKSRSTKVQVLSHVSIKSICPC